jgi:hypothetical protein
MADYLSDPVIEDLDAKIYEGTAGGSVFVIVGDDFKVVKVTVVIRSADGRRLEEGMAAPVGGDQSKVWRYRAATDHSGPVVLTVEATATDRCGHSAFAATTLEVIP